MAPVVCRLVPGSGNARPTEQEFWKTLQLLAEHSFLISKDRMLILLCLAYRGAANPK